jgi:hypothetical protein
VEGEADKLEQKFDVKAKTVGHIETPTIGNKVGEQSPGAW